MAVMSRVEPRLNLSLRAGKELDNGMNVSSQLPLNRFNHYTPQNITMSENIIVAIMEKWVYGIIQLGL